MVSTMPGFNWEVIAGSFHMEVRAIVMFLLMPSRAKSLLVAHSTNFMAESLSQFLSLDLLAMLMAQGTTMKGSSRAGPRGSLATPTFAAGIWVLAGSTIWP